MNERGLFEAEVRRRVDETGFGEDALGGEDAVNRAAECGLAGEWLDIAVEPVLEEEGADAITGFEASNSGANGYDLAGGVGAEDAR